MLWWSVVDPSSGGCGSKEIENLERKQNVAPDVYNNEICVINIEIKYLAYKLGFFSPIDCVYQQISANNFNGFTPTPFIAVMWQSHGTWSDIQRVISYIWIIMYIVWKKQKIIYKNESKCHYIYLAFSN